MFGAECLMEGWRKEGVYVWYMYASWTDFGKAMALGPFLHVPLEYTVSSLSGSHGVSLDIHHGPSQIYSTLKA